MLAVLSCRLPSVVFCCFPTDDGIRALVGCLGLGGGYSGQGMMFLQYLLGGGRGHVVYAVSIGRLTGA